jgi:Dolichyl-phosphate-mannose-protein mannosyltransferase
MLRLPLRTLSKAEGIVAFAALLGFIVALQFLGGAYASGFGGYPDEPAHMVTSLMVRDFIAGLDFRHPLQFAQQYYYHYPKVAIGHWPPVFYGALGTWFLIVGASRSSALMFIAIVATATATIIYFTGKRLMGRWAGIFAAVLFVASPLVQESSAEVMIEHPVTLGMLVSTLCFARFAKTGRIGDGVAFGTISAAAILTDGDAWALALVPGVTVALTNRWYLLRHPGLWLSAVPVLVACVPWYIFTLHMRNGTWVGSTGSSWVQAIPAFSWSISLAVGFPILIFAFIGVWTTIIHVTSRTKVVPEWPALAGLAIGTLILHCVTPVGFDARYMMTLLPSIVLFSSAGVDDIAHRLSARLPIGIVQIGLAVALMALFSLDSFALPIRLRNNGYARLVGDVMARVSNVPQIWLISSGSTGEGGLVTAVALNEGHPKSYVLRGKQILAGGDWLWNSTEDRFDTPAKLARLLDDMHVTIIVIDDQIPSGQRRPYQDHLQELMAHEGKKWELIEAYPQIQDETVFPNSLHVYARRPVASLAVSTPALPLDRLKALMVHEELR